MHQVAIMDVSLVALAHVQDPVLEDAKAVLVHAEAIVPKHVLIIALRLVKEWDGTFNY